MTVHLGFEVGSGAAVEIPLAHTFVCGQTQQSGKTTTLRAIVERSGQRALAFITKRGEEFPGRAIRPFLPREGEQPIHWRAVENILASALEARNLKFERLQIINAAKGARSLDDVQANIRRLLAKSKAGRNQEIYTLLDEYLELVLPQMRALRASDVLDLQPGLNVMDLSGIAGQTQAMVIRAALERINYHETDVLTVLPEAWEFAPRGRSAPAKDEAINMARKGAAPKVRNFLLVDSQDVAGVENVVRQACSVWLLGVQRELNELKRALSLMSAGVKKPRAADVATLELGQFYACWGSHVVKTYVQPSWMDDVIAERIAKGSVTVDQAARHYQSIERDAARVASRFEGRPLKEDSVTKDEAAQLARENEDLRRENGELRRRLDALEARDGGQGTDRADRNPAVFGAGAVADAGAVASPRGRSASGPARPSSDRQFTVEESFDNEALYQAFKARLIQELPGDATVMRVITSTPALTVEVQRHVITVDGSSTRGRIARLIAEGFFEKARTTVDINAELSKRGSALSNIELGNEVKALIEMGFFTRDNKWIALVDGMSVNVVEK